MSLIPYWYLLHMFVSVHLNLGMFMFIFYSAPVGERSIAISLSVVLSVCLSASISLEPLGRSSRNFVRRPWFGPPPTALRYVMYFRFYG